MPIETFVFVVYPNVTQLDFTAPWELWSRCPNVRCVLASVAGGNVRADSGLVFEGAAQLSEIASCDVLFVPGGSGTPEALQDARLLHEIERLARHAETLSAVCTGSLLLARAGLLQGKRAACHWAFRDLLETCGATPDPARVVRDGNVLTGGGVTAGFDLALQLAADRYGDEFAQGLQLALEYAPSPPFQSGRPELAPASVRRAVEQRLHPRRQIYSDALVAATSARLGAP